ncbi:APC family permease [Pseudemcibacter aquimaris]|uniref:APC family permease n=1 Tax=Pseudemcibacter aquimaris TaxID=2857064 RepID=UPI002013A72A|nr:amino acid permease [Pseudemcibacter aquimaris]MCC3862229.1 amino acid permease [Pseudemcibacter aquimaris]WDU58981.1 amino acid permease [Pseudemcibacter aquimaris]
MSTNTLAKGVKLHQLFAIGFGTMVGVGWIMLAGGWIESAGTFGASIAFFVGALAVMIIGLCYGEMGMMFPQSGGEVVYAYEGFGTEISYAMGWFLALIFISACAFEAVSTAWILGAIFPALSQGTALYEFLDAPITVYSLLIGVGGSAILTWINLRGGRTAAKFQNLVIILFILSAAFFIIAGIANGSMENAKTSWMAKIKSMKVIINSDNFLTNTY